MEAVKDKFIVKSTGDDYIQEGEEYEIEVLLNVKFKLHENSYISRMDFDEIFDGRGTHLDYFIFGKSGDRVHLYKSPSNSCLDLEEKSVFEVVPSVIPAWVEKDTPLELLNLLSTMNESAAFTELFMMQYKKLKEEVTKQVEDI